ncbi:MAG: SDR family NAD(P)-dependent oxidoreductase [Rhodanobacteraceae bacterium]|nr:SDR family NAD(P)-dependent oxidoreductase [Rhodanobacteraceae bacterium]
MSELLASVTPPTEAWAGAGLGGRQILVVGASGALGRACALAAADHGASVVLLGRRVAPLEKLYDEIEALGAPQPAIYPMNLEGATPADYAELSSRIIDGCGRLDGVIFAAGRLHGLTPIEQFEPEEWLRTLQVNVNAPFLLLQSLLPALKASSAAPAVLFFVDEIERATRAYWGAYGVAQAALRALIGMAAKNGASRACAPWVYCQRRWRAHSDARRMSVSPPRAWWRLRSTRNWPRGCWPMRLPSSMARWWMHDKFPRRATEPWKSSPPPSCCS